MSATSLEAALRSHGVPCRVEPLDRLALLIPDGPVAVLEAAARRRETIALVRDHGFTHVAIELVDEPVGDAPLPRD